MKSILLLVCFIFLVNTLTLAQGAKWEYTEDTDMMTGRKNYYAETTSLPDDISKQGINLVIRHFNNRNDVLLNLEEGLFNYIGEAYYLEVRFDMGKTESFITNQSLDRNYKTIFLRNANRFIKKAKASEVVMIRAYLYNEGNKIFTFYIKDLKWDH